jgi:hypothetical protein
MRSLSLFSFIITRATRRRSKATNGCFQFATPGRSPVFRSGGGCPRAGSTRPLGRTSQCQCYLLVEVEDNATLYLASRVLRHKSSPCLITWFVGDKWSLAGLCRPTLIDIIPTLRTPGQAHTGRLGILEVLNVTYCSIGRHC